MLTGENGLLTKASEAKNVSAHGAVRDAISLAYNEYQLELKTAKTTKVASLETIKIADITVTKSSGEYGINGSGDSAYFVGQLSYGKSSPDSTMLDNTQLGNVPYENGRKFTTGHFLHDTNYNGILWDEEEQNFMEVTNANVYICWDGEYGEISKLDDLRNYNGATWDIFDASSGAWLYTVSSLVRPAV